MKIETIKKSYVLQGIEFKGYLAFEENILEQRPGILVFPEWWGLNEYIQKRTKLLAELGYVAFGVDMYGGGKTANSADEAVSLMNEVKSDNKIVMDRVQAAYDFLKNYSLCETEKICAIGYCFGGALVLNMARFGMNLKAVVSFHGALDSLYSPAVGGIMAKILVCHGADDDLISKNSIEKFKSEMNFAKANFEFVSYEGAKHGFSNFASDLNGERYNLPLAYNENADIKSWKAMKNLFEDVL